MGIISLNQYTNDNLPSQHLKDIIRNIEGNKYRTKGYKRPNPKLVKESFI